MKKFLATLATLAVATISVGVPAAAFAASPSDFPDEQFRACVSETTNGDFSDAALQELYSLECDNNHTTFKISSIGGIEKLTNLISFESSGNTITDITPLNDITTLEAVYFNNGATQATTSHPIIDIETLTNPTVEYISFTNVAFNKSFTEVAPNPDFTGEIKIAYSTINDKLIDNVEAAAIVEAFPNASFYDFTGNNITDVSFLNGNTNYNVESVQLGIVYNKFTYLPYQIVKGETYNLNLKDENGNQILPVVEFGDATVASDGTITFGEEQFVRVSFEHILNPETNQKFAGEAVDFQIYNSQAEIDEELSGYAGTQNVSATFNDITASLTIDDPHLTFNQISSEILHAPQKWRYVITVNNDGSEPLVINSLKAFSSDTLPSDIDLSSVETTQVIPTGTDLTSVSEANNGLWIIPSGQSNTYIVEALFPKANMVSRDSNGEVVHFAWNNKIVMNVEQLIFNENTETNLVWDIYQGTGLWDEPIWTIECEYGENAEGTEEGEIGACVQGFALSGTYTGSAEQLSVNPPPVVVEPPVVEVPVVETPPVVVPPVVNPPAIVPPVVVAPPVVPPRVETPPVVEVPKTIKNGGEDILLPLAGAFALILAGVVVYVIRRKLAN